MKVLSKIILLFFFSLHFSCNDQPGDKTRDDSEIRYKYFRLEEAGWKSLKSTQTVDDISFTATEVPLPFYIVRETGNQDMFEADSIYQINKNERLIEFTFEQDKEEDLLQSKFTNMDYEEAITYLAFTVENDFFAVTKSNDTIACSGAIYERAFKVAPHQKVLLFFSGIDPDEEVQLVYNDKLYRKGILKFTFTKNITKILL